MEKADIGPNEDIGFAILDKDNKPVLATVANTRRGAVVNGLLVIFGKMTWDNDRESVIEYRFKQACKNTGWKVGRVKVSSIMVLEEDTV
jgi:hypothetical protein